MRGRNYQITELGKMLFEQWQKMLIEQWQKNDNSPLTDAGRKMLAEWSNEQWQKFDQQVETEVNKGK